MAITTINERKRTRKERLRDQRQARREAQQARRETAGDATPVTDPRDHPKYGAYQRAVAAGKERKWLRNHPNFAAAVNATKPPKSGLGKLKSDNATTAQIVHASTREAAEQARAATGAQNVQEYQTDTGSAGGYIDPETGRYVQYSEGSQNQKDILAGGENLRIMGQQAAQGALQGYNPFQTTAQAQGQFEGGTGAVGAGNALIQGYEKFGMSGSPEERQRIEEAVYDRLTRNVERDRKQEFDEMEQRMFNRGIPIDPTNPAYKREMDALNEKYSTIKENAAQTATQMGGEELQRSFGMGLQSHQQGMSDIGSLYGIGEAAYNTRQAAQSQQFGQDLAGQQQRMNEMNQLSQMGTGYIGAPQLEYQSPDYMQVNPAEVFLGKRGQNIEKYGVDAQKDITAMKLATAEAEARKAEAAAQQAENDIPFQ